MTQKENGVGYIHGGTQQASYRSADVVEWSCPLCGSPEEERITTERKVLGIVRCTTCDLIRVSPRLRSPEMIYQGDPNIYREEFRFIVEEQQPHHRDRNYRHDLDLIARYKPAGRFLDIGSGAGMFLRLAKNRSWTLQGVEPSAQTAKLARQWWGLDILTGFVEQLNLAEASYDIVTMTDVFEHVVNPRELLATVRRILKPNGIAFIKVPNGRFNLLKFHIRSRMSGVERDNFDSYEHVCHYTHKTLSRMLDACGFRVRNLSVGMPVQLPVWHEHVGHYYQHASPWSLSWQTNTLREILFQLSRVESRVFGEVGWLAPNISCIAEPKP